MATVLSIIAVSTELLSIIAILISALTALWTIVWSIYTHRRQTRPQVTVLGTFALPLYLDGQAGKQSVDVTVTNAGPVPVTITGVAFEIEGSAETLAIIEWLIQNPRPLPTPLGPGEHWTALVEADRLKGSLAQRFGPTAARRLRPVARDPAGGRYAAEKWLEL